MLFLQPLIALLLVLVASAHPSHTKKIQAFNLNIKNDAGGKLLDGEVPWSERKEGLIATIKNRTDQYETLLGLQEVIDHQLTDILDGLGPDWEFYGVHRALNGSDNEINPVIYNREQFELLESRTYWYSETPDVPSKDWGSKYNRILTFTKFHQFSSGRRFNFLTTHYDAFSEEARLKSANLTLEIINKKLGNDEAVFLTGDFNTQESDQTYQVLASDLTNADDSLTKRSTFGIDYNKVIDYIFYKKNDDSKLQLIEFETGSGVYDGYFISDHSPSWAVFEF